MKRRRAFAALLALFGLVFAQLMASAHACDIVRPGQSGATSVHAVTCPEKAASGEVADPLCAQHCLNSQASVDNSPPAPMAVASVPALRVDYRSIPSPMGVAPAWRPVPAAAPPPAILFGVLRL